MSSGLLFENFRDLIRKIFALAKFPPSNEADNSVELEVDGIRFTLRDCSSNDAQAVECSCDFGEPPTMKRDAVFARLLEINHLTPVIDAPKFSIDIDTGHVVLSYRVPAGKLTALDFLNVLAQHAGQAKLWRMTWFLSDPDTPNQTASRRAGVEKRLGYGERRSK